MALSTTMFTNDLRFMASDLPCSLTAINGTALGTAITGTFGEIGREQDLIINEMTSSDLTMRDFEATFVQADFSTIPGESDSVTIDGTIYYIERREDDPSGVGVTFTLRRN